MIEAHLIYGTIYFLSLTEQMVRMQILSLTGL
jgi:hypothetical protein